MLHQALMLCFFLRRFSCRWGKNIQADQSEKQLTCVVFLIKTKGRIEHKARSKFMPDGKMKLASLINSWLSLHFLLKLMDKFSRKLSPANLMLNGISKLASLKKHQ